MAIAVSVLICGFNIPTPKNLREPKRHQANQKSANDAAEKTEMLVGGRDNQYPIREN